MGQLAKMDGSWPGYRMSKAALNALTRLTTRELEGSAIKINAVCPGWCRTAMGGPDATRTPDDGARGIVWAALLGPIGWLVVALSKSAQVECPKCRRGNPADAKSCRHCGINLKLAAERSPRSELKQVDRNSGW